MFYQPWEFVKTVALVGLLLGAYHETGPFTTVIVGLMVIRIEDIIDNLNITTENSDCVVSFLIKKHRDFAEQAEQYFYGDADE